MVLELARLFRAAGEGSTLERIALKAVFMLCSLVLQKPSRTSKSKDHISCIERRLNLWMDGNLNELVLEGRAIQQRLRDDCHCAHRSDPDGRLAYSFAKFMFDGKTKRALDMLSGERKGGLLHLSDVVLRKIPQYEMSLKVSIPLLLRPIRNVWMLLSIPPWFITPLFLMPWMVL